MQEVKYAAHICRSSAWNCACPHISVRAPGGRQQETLRGLQPGRRTCRPWWQTTRQWSQVCAQLALFAYWLRLQTCCLPVVSCTALTLGSLLADATAGKPTEWPDLVGQDANHAKEVIAAFGYNVFLVPEVRNPPLRRSCTRDIRAGCRRSSQFAVS